jgi:16S rRNA G966 N2-methylase RsmD
MNLKIKPEYEVLLPKLSKEEYEALKESIKTEGQHYPIIINQEGFILDGHHRFQICQELSVTPRYEVKEFTSLLHEKKFVIESNLTRRHLNKFQRAKLVLPLLEIEKEFARQREEHRLGEGLGQICPRLTTPKRVRKSLTEGQKVARRLKAKQRREKNKIAGIIPNKPVRARTIVADKGRIGERTLEKARSIMEKGSLELQGKVESGKTSIDHAYKAIKKLEQMEEVSRQQIVWRNTDKITLFEGTFQEKGSEIPDNSIHAIITDPPYGKEYLEVWKDLADLAERVLIPSGFLITYSGQLYLPEVLHYLNEKLHYYWICSLPLNNRNLITNRNVYSLWKPILIFCKLPLIPTEKYLMDVINNSGREKNHHPWQQSEVELNHLIDVFVPENGLILDPMAGSGTTLLAASKNRRRCIGIEKDHQTMEIMKGRLKEW